MTKTQTRREATAARTAEREVLAEAIARHAEATKYLNKICAAAERASRLETAAFAATEKVAKDMAAARAGEEKNLLDRLVAGDDLETGVAGTEQAAAEAERRQQRARQAFEVAKAEIAVAQQGVERAQRGVDDAVTVAIASDVRDRIPQLLEEAQAVQADLIARRAELRYLHQKGLIVEPRGEQPVRDFLFHNGDVLPGTIGSTEFANYDEHPAARVWAAARDALATDADALLPTKLPTESELRRRSPPAEEAAAPAPKLPSRMAAVATHWGEPVPEPEEEIAVASAARG